MATALSSISLPTPKRLLVIVSAKSETPRALRSILSWRTKTSGAYYKAGGRRATLVRPIGSAASTPRGISEQVSESIKNAEETCAGDPESGECVAAWDEVEELSAAASHARDKAKDADPLEEYCKDNPETDECRTYED